MKGEGYKDEISGEQFGNVVKNAEVLYKNTERSLRRRYNGLESRVLGYLYNKTTCELDKPNFAQAI